MTQERVTKQATVTNQTRNWSAMLRDQLDMTNRSKCDNYPIRDNSFKLCWHQMKAGSCDHPVMALQPVGGKFNSCWHHYNNYNKIIIIQRRIGVPLEIDLLRSHHIWRNSFPTFPLGIDKNLTLVQWYDIEKVVHFDETNTLIKRMPLPKICYLLML